MCCYLLSLLQYLISFKKEMFQVAGFEPTIFNF